MCLFEDITTNGYVDYLRYPSGHVVICSIPLTPTHGALVLAVLESNLPCSIYALSHLVLSQVACSLNRRNSIAVPPM